MFLTTDAVGGVWRYTVELCRVLSARGYEVDVYVVGPAPATQQQRDLAPFARLSISGHPLDWRTDHPGQLEDIARDAACMSSGSDVVLLHTPAVIGSVAWPAPVVVMMHSCLASWFETVRGGRVPPDYAWRAQAAAAGLGRASAIAAPTRAFARQVERVYGLQGVASIHNGCRPANVPHASRERAVLTAGRLWDEGKNIGVLDAAAAGLSAPLRAAGSTQHPDGWEVRLHHAQPLGLLDDAGMAQAYATHTVFAAASLYEPFGLATLEAAQSGMALVLADIPSFRELWDGAALFVNNDPDAWRAALEAALDDAPCWAARAQQHAARYTAEACADATIAFLSRAMA